MSESNIVVWVTAYSTLLRIVLAAVLVLAGLLGARAFRALFQLIRSRFEPHWPEWVQILFNGLRAISECLLWYSAFLALPWPESWVPGLSGGAATALSIAAALLLTRGALELGPHLPAAFAQHPEQAGPGDQQDDESFL